MLEVIFLAVLALVWIVFATIQDLRTREIANWLNFSLIIFALGFRFFYIFFNEVGFGFFYQGLIWFGIMFVVGNLFYHMRMFAGGDAKLMIALGSVLSFSNSFSVNLKIFGGFFFLFLFVGAVYGFIYSWVLALKHFASFKKEFSSKVNKNKKIIYSIMFLGILIMFLGFYFQFFFIIGFLVFLLPYFYFYAKSVDEVCMIKKLNTSKLTEGDWLYKDVKLGKKLIKASWGGLSKKDIDVIKRKKTSILVRQGIPFTPVFLISFLVLGFVYIFNAGLWNSFW